MSGFLAPRRYSSVHVRRYYRNSISQCSEDQSLNGGLYDLKLFAIGGSAASSIVLRCHFISRLAHMFLSGSGHGT